jgi:hypothetical protein
MINFEDIPEILFHAIAGAEHLQTLHVLGNFEEQECNSTHRWRQYS